MPLRPAAVPALAAVLALAALPSPAAARRPPAGPPGDRFYTPPRVLPGERHGDVVRARRLRGGAALGAGADETLVLYRSRGLDGSAIAVSGAIAVPRGRPPRGGWPVVSYAHGTTGIADACAPTRTPEVNPPSGYPDALLRPWLRAGFAVLRTDYQGLGTPGVHQYLVGAAEARSVLDIVRAARRLHPLSRRVVLAGHSQGGHAALWAAALAPAWTPELRVRGTVALAPASHIATQARAVGALTRPSQLSPIAGLILRGLDAARPSLHAAAVLSERARALFPHTLTRCLTALGRPESLGGLAPAELFAPTADLGPLVRALAASDPEHLRIRTPVRVEQGTTDEVTYQAFTDALVEAYRANGVPVTYRTYPGADHIAVVRAAAPDVNRWVGRRLRR